MNPFSMDESLLQNPDALAEQWRTLRAAHHHLHSPDAARRLRVPEAALMASHQGQGAWSLRPDLSALLNSMEQWGRVILVARNGLGVGMVLGSGVCVSSRKDWLVMQEPAGPSELFVQPSAVHEVWLLEDHDAHGHTFSVNAFDGQGHAILRLFLMSKQGREIALPHLQRFETDRVRGAWAPAVPAATLADPAQTAACFSNAVPEHDHCGPTDASRDPHETVIRYFEQSAERAGPVTLRFCGAAVGFQYHGPFGKTSTTPGAVHAHDTGFKLHLRLDAARNVTVDSVHGLIVREEAGGWVQVAPTIAPKPTQTTRRALLQALVGLPALGAVGWLAPHRRAEAQARGTRWLSLQSFVSEIVVALGGADRIVAIGGGQDHLGELLDRPRIPGFRQTSAEMLLAFEPTDLLVTQEHLMPQTLQQLQAAGVRVHLLDPRSDAQGVVARITQVGLLLQKEQDGQSLSARFQRDLAHQHSQAVWATPPRGVFILAGGGRPTVVAGGDTHPGALLRMAGTVNLGDALTGFKSLSQEFLASAQPEFILTNPDGLQGTPPVVLAAPGARLTAAARQGRVIALPGYLLQGMGIHTPRAIAQLREALKPWFA